MNTTSFNLIADEYIRAASDTQLSSSETHLLATLISEEDQHDYNQLLETTLSQDILQILHQVIFLTTFKTLLFTFLIFFQLTSLLHPSSSAIWTTIVLLKKLIIQQYSIDLLTIIACITLSSKYQDSSSQSIDYEFIAHCCHIQNIQLIHVSFLPR